MAGQKVRFGVVGTAFGTAVHIPALQLSTETEVVAVCSSTQERAEAVARRFQIPRACDDYRTLVDLPEVDAVAVVVPPALHYPVTMAALAAKKHVLCEKPFALNLQQAVEMYEKACALGETHMVHHEGRFSPGRAKIKELVDAGYIGQVLHVNFTGFFHQYRVERPWDWHSRREDGGGMMGSRGSHYIDALRDWFGEIAGCSAWLDILAKERRVPFTDEWRPVATDDAFDLVLGFRAGGRAVVQMSNGTHFGKGVRVEAYGTEGTLILDTDNRLYGGRAGESRLSEISLPPLEVPASELVTPPDQIDFRQFVEDRGSEWPGYVPPSPKYLSGLIYNCLRLLRHFVRGVRGEEAPSPSFYDGVRCQEVMDAIYLSSSEGRWITLPLAESEIGQPTLDKTGARTTLA